MRGKCISITGCNTGMDSTSTLTEAETKTQLDGLATSGSHISTQSLNRSNSQRTGPITTAPFNISTCAPPSGNSSNVTNTCKIQDELCSFQGSEHALDGLRDVCVLWDSSCCGNSALAAKRYWNEQLHVITNNKCFVNHSPDCTKSNPSERMSAFAGFKDWMRGPQCYANSPLILGDTVCIFMTLHHALSITRTSGNIGVVCRAFICPHTN